MRLIDGYAPTRGLTGEYLSMEREEILALVPGNWVPFLANDGKVRMLRINGKIRTYKRDRERIEIPVKYGFRECATLHAYNMDRLLVRIRDPITYEDLQAGESTAIGKVQ